LRGQVWICYYGAPSLTSKPKSKSKLYYDRHSVGQSVLVSGTHLRPATNFSHSFFNFFLTVSDLLIWGALSDEKSGLYLAQTSQETSFQFLRFLSYPGKQRVPRADPSKGCFTVAVYIAVIWQYDTMCLCYKTGCMYVMKLGKFTSEEHGRFHAMSFGRLISRNYEHLYQ
jgi:hypothetical protein